MADVAEIQARLEAGVQSLMSEDGFKRYLFVQSGFHNYSRGNTLLILVQRPDATRVAGFHAWRDLGHTANKVSIVTQGATGPK